MGTVAPDGEDPESWPMASPEDDVAGGEDETELVEPALSPCETSFGAAAQAPSNIDAENKITNVRQLIGAEINFIKTPSEKILLNWNAGVSSAQHAEA